MNRFFSMFLAIAATLAFATSAPAAVEYFWDGGVLSEGYDEDTGEYYDIFTPTGNSSWQDPLNWIGDYLPNASYKAVITSGFTTYGNYSGEFPPPTTAVNLASGSATCNYVMLGGTFGSYSGGTYPIYYGGSGSLTVDGGTLTATDGLYAIALAAKGGQTVGLTINDGTFQSNTGQLAMIVDSLTDAGTAFVTVNGGSLTLGGNININGAKTATFTQTGGSVSCTNMSAGAFAVYTTNSVIDISGGSLSVSALLYLSASGATTNNYGTLRVNGSDATINVGSFDIRNGRGMLAYVMDLAGVSPINVSSSGVVNLGSVSPGVLDLDFRALTATIGDITLINNQSAAAISNTFGTINVQGAVYDSGAGTFTLPDNSYYTLNYAGGDGNDLVLEAHAVPEPATAALLACGLSGLLAYAWRRRK